MALRNYIYSKHNQDNNINTMIFHKDSDKQSSSSVNTTESARDTSTTTEHKVNTETVNDEERSKTLVSHAMENKIEELNSEEHNSRNDSINTLNSVSEVSNAEHVHNTTNNLAA